jgi:AcrR family transcriptional regulator
MTAPKAKRRTAERILEIALRLFNERGEPHVTTTLIADELNISPGNLYYHFKNKDAISEPLFQRFAQEIRESLALSEQTVTVEDMWFQLHLVFEVIWRYRFIYRDLNDLLTRNRKLRELFRRIIAEQTQASVAVFRGLVAAREMVANEEELTTLAKNVVLIATYWLSFENACGVLNAEIGRGVYQVMSAIAPFLVGESRLLLEQLRADYL